jgi:hypothetical protein
MVIAITTAAIILRRNSATLNPVTCLPMTV